MENLLHVKDLSVTRGYQPLLESLDLSLKPGDILQIKGPNGSGKTSLLLTLAGVLKPSRGAIERDNLHWQGAQSSLKDSLTLWENLKLWANLEGANESDINSALKALHMDPLNNEPLKNLSQGQRQRASLSRILLNFKPLWLLDEPFSHLDQTGSSLLIESFKNHLSQGGSIVFTSHQDVPFENLKTLDLCEYKCFKGAA